MPGQQAHKLWWAVFSLFCGIILGILVNIMYTRQVDADSDRQNLNNDRKWCTLLIELDDAYNGSPDSRPTTEIGRRIAASIHELRRDLGCGGG